MSYDSDLAPSLPSLLLTLLSPIPSSVLRGHPHTCTLSRCVLLQLPPFTHKGSYDTVLCTEKDLVQNLYLNH